MTERPHDTAWPKLRGYGRLAGGLRPRDLGRTATAIVTSLYVTSPVVHACPICFQTDDEAMSAGVRAAVGVLFAVTVAVIGSIAAFAMRLVRAEARVVQRKAVAERPVPRTPVPERPVPGRPVPL